jgi:hypothetical protein
MISSSGMPFILIRVWLVRSSTECPQGQTEVLVARPWRVSSRKTEYASCNLILRIISKTAQPVNWQPGQALPTQNEWSWTNLSSVLYVEQPIGTGFSQGKPTANVRGFPN